MKTITTRVVEALRVPRTLIPNRLAPSLMLAAALCFLVLGCQSREVGKGTPAPSASTTALSAGGKVVFADDFERAELGEKWHRGTGEGGRGTWRVEEGAVVVSGVRNDPLWLKFPLPEKVRVEFDATALSEVGDIKVEIFGDGEAHESGYILIFGGWNNALDVMARLDEHGEDRKARTTAKVAPHQTYRMAVERLGDSSVKWFVDGQLFMAFDDPRPLVGEGHQYFAFSNWDAPVRFDNVQVFDLE